jgi:hypothetical protein
MVLAPAVVVVPVLVFGGDEVGGDEVGGDEVGGDEVGGDEVGGDEDAAAQYFKPSSPFPEVLPVP